MAALTQARGPRRQTIRSIDLPLAIGAKAFQGGMACLDTSAHTLKPGAAANANLTRVGTFAQTYDNSGGAATTQVLVDLDREIVVQWFDNATGGAAVTTLFSTAYILDDHTVTSTSAGNSSAGVVWAINPAGTQVAVGSPIPI